MRTRTSDRPTSLSEPGPIGEREWQAMLSDLRRSLNDFQVPESGQEELIASVQSTKGDIVVREN